MKKSSLRLFGLLIFFFTSCGQDQEKLLSKIPDPKTLNESYVSNPDHILTAETVAELNSKLRVLDQAGTAHIDVVFVKSIGDLVPKDVAHELFNTWKIGSKETNNGLLMLIVEDQKRIDFETGFGLEGILPDVICYRIQQKYMIPYAKQNDFNGAVKSGVDAVIAHLRNEGAESPVAADTAQYALTDTSSLSVVPES
ncbi:MAG TPA: TPM domain-containing protein, partial [Pedobacter sp.]|nr:TPM domain-containing protein [Pedobacter sp.]